MTEPGLSSWPWSPPWKQPELVENCRLLGSKNAAGDGGSGGFFNFEEPPPKAVSGRFGFLVLVEAVTDFSWFRFGGAGIL